MNKTLEMLVEKKSADEIEALDLPLPEYKDFIRTSDSWANQTKILSLQFDALKASLGQGLINLFTPLIKQLNLFIARLKVAADTFKAFTETLMGKKASDATSTTDAITDGLNGVTAAATEAAKATGQLSIDELNVISDTSSDSSTSGSTSSSDDVSASSTAIETATSQAGLLKTTLQDISAAIKNTFGASTSGAIAKVSTSVGKLKTIFKKTFTDIGTLGQGFKQWMVSDLPGVVNQGITNSSVNDRSNSADE